MSEMRTTGLAAHWLSQSEMWLAELPYHGVPDAAIVDLRQNAKVAVHDAIEETERANEAALATARRKALAEAAYLIATAPDHLFSAGPNARKLYPADALERADAEIARLREVLALYADVKTYTDAYEEPYAPDDPHHPGAAARAALTPEDKASE